jgi:hypothetical protein
LLAARRKTVGLGNGISRGGLVAIVALALVALSFSAQVAHARSRPSAYARLESAMLGPAHAAEHRALRRIIAREQRRWRHMTPTQRGRAQRAATVSSAASLRTAQRAAAIADPTTAGQWTTTPFQLDPQASALDSLFAINAVVLPKSGKVLFWSYPPRAYMDDPNNPNGTRAYDGHAAVWDPTAPDPTAASAFTDVTSMLPMVDIGPPYGLVHYPLFCTAQSLLPDGRVLITGGNLRYGGDDGYTANGGVNLGIIFDPDKITAPGGPWSQPFQMHNGRWYPSTVELADGRILALSGYTGASPGGTVNSELEVFDSSVSSPVYELQGSSANRSTELYPHLFVMKDGRVLLAGPDEKDSAILDPSQLVDASMGTGSNPWTSLPDHSSKRQGSTAVLLPGDASGSNKVMQIGGMPKDFANETQSVAALDSADSIDLDAISPSWTDDANHLNVARSYANTVQLPDGSMVEVGGGRGFEEDAANGGTGADLWAVYGNGFPSPSNPAKARQVELWNPLTGSWALGPPQVEDRGYHSTAVLLPDGRVFSGGDDRWPDMGPPDYWSRFDTGEIYSPPYLFQESLAARPQITSAPGAAPYMDEFGIGTSRDDITRVVLVAPSAVTHAVDMNQRVVPLAITGAVPGKGVNARTPGSPNLAPPGYYMLFALDATGTPSIAKWIRLGSDAADNPTLQPDPPPGGGQQAPPSGGQQAPSGAPPAPTPPTVMVDRTRPLVSLGLAGTDLAAARRRRSVRVKLKINEPGRIVVTPGAFGVVRRKRKIVNGQRSTFSFTRSGTRIVTLPLGSVVARLLTGRRVTLYFTLRAEDRARNVTTLGARGTLKLARR